MKYRKKPVVVEATQWFKNGDHPQDDCGQLAGEGRVVRYFRRPDMPGEQRCRNCNIRMHEHGWIDMPKSSWSSGGHIVCPGDFIITGEKNEKYPCKPDVFEKTYEPVETQ